MRGVGLAEVFLQHVGIDIALGRTCGMGVPHATHALQGGAELTAVRDNLRHASIATTSIYLHSDDVKRARQMAAVFAEPTR